MPTTYLLADYRQDANTLIPAGSTCELDSGTAAALIAAGKASASLPRPPGAGSGITLYATQAALAADNAANYRRGTTAYVGPDAAGQYAEWYSNGARWRPRSLVIFQQTTPVVLTDISTTEADMLSFTLPKELIGPNDVITIDHYWSWTSSAASKSSRIYVAGLNIMTQVTNSNVGFRGSSWIEFRNSLASQGYPGPLIATGCTDGVAGASAGLSTATFNAATTDVIIKASGQFSAAAGGSSNITIHRFSVRMGFVA